VALFFLILPSLWNDPQTYNLGGDDSRLYLYAPLEFMRSVALYSWYGTGFGWYLPQQRFITFLMILSPLEIISKGVNIQNLTYGLIFSSSFIIMYKLLIEAIKGATERIVVIHGELAGIVGSTSYILFPLMFYFWQHPIVTEIVGLLAYPAIFLFLFKGINAGKVEYLIFGALVSLIFSIAIVPGPLLYAFVISIVIFILIYSILDISKAKIVLVYSLLYCLLIVLFNAFWFLPFLDTLSTYIRQFESEIPSEVVMRAMARRMGIYYTLVGFPSTWLLNELTNGNYLISVSYVSVALIIIIFLPSLLSEKKSNIRFHGLKKIWLASTIPLLILAYFTTVNVGEVGIGFYMWLIKTVPGWVIVRTFYRKFAIVYDLFYSLSLGLSVYMLTISFHRRSREKKFVAKVRQFILYLFIGLLIVPRGMPFLSGDIIHQPIDSDTTITRNVVIPEYYIHLLNYLANESNSARILSLPLLNGAWTFFKSATGNGSYIGLPPARMLRGMYQISGITNLKRELENGLGSEIGAIAEKLLMTKNYSSFKNFLKITGTRFIIYDPSSFSILTPDRVGPVESIWGYGIFQTKSTVEELINSTGMKFIRNFSPIRLYELQDAYPMVYVTDELVYFNGSLEYLLKSIDVFGDKMMAFYDGDNMEVIRKASVTILVNQNNLIVRRGNNSMGLPVVEFKKVSPVKYIVNISNAHQPFIIVFSDTFHPGWEIYRGELRDLEVLVKPSLTLLHFRVNEYANGWYIDPKQIDLDGDGIFTLTIYFTPQKLFYLGTFITGGSLLGCLTLIMLKSVNLSKIKTKFKYFGKYFDMCLERCYFNKT
jgi:hypothetical protein